MSDTAPKPPRVLHYLDAVREEAGGVVRCVIDLCGVLAEQGCEVTLATLDAKDVPAHWREKSNAPRVVELPAEQWTAELRQAAEQVDVLHLHTPWDRRNTGIAKTANSLAKPYIVSVHGMLDDWCMDHKGLKKRVYLWLAGRRMLEGAYRVHCTAEGEAQQAGKWYPRAQSAVLPLVVDMPNPDTLPGPQLATETFPALATDDTKLLFLSRLHPKKGVDLLLRAAKLLVDRGTSFQLFVAGPGEPAYVTQLESLAAELGIADFTHFIGMVQGDTKLSLYQACDLFVLPTHQENFGLVLPESLACGTPVVTTRGVDIWPEIEAAGSTITDNQPESLANELERLLAERAALAERGLQGRQYIQQWLDPTRVAQGYIDLYRQAVQNK